MGSLCFNKSNKCMLTNELKDILKPRAVNEMQHVRDILNEQNISIDVIADIGANIGY